MFLSIILVVSLLRAYTSIHKFDVICISETFLNSDTAFDDNLKIEGYNIVRSDHPCNSRRGGVCIYYNQSLALKILDMKVGLSPSKKHFLFALMIALQKWWKMLFISS